ncbi:MAG: hypothetical protein ACOCUS_04675 [Polyangiales bacterium]
MSRRAVWVLGSVVACLLAAPAIAHAQVGLRVHEAGDGGVRVDGMLSDWRGVRFSELGEGDDASMRYALAYDGDGLYVGAEVRDQRLIRNPRPGRKEDAIVLTLAMPRRGGYRGVELWLWAGVQGRTAAKAGRAQLGRRPRPLRGAEIVEGPRDGGPGYVLEAFIPWRAIPGSSGWQRGRGAIRLRDVDKAAHPEVEDEPASAQVDPDALDRLPMLMPTGGTSAMVRRFQKAQGLLGTAPRFDRGGDVAGDGREERVVVVGEYIVVVGPGYKNGESYDFMQLPVDSASDIKKLSLKDMTGDGKAEALVSMRQHGARGSRDVFQVIGFDGSSVRPIFGVETRKQTEDGWVVSRLRIRRARRGPPLVEVRTGRAQGLDAESYRESPARDVEPILLPWGPVLARRYQYHEGEFQKVWQRDNPRYVDPEERRRAQRQRRQREQRQQQRDQARQRAEAERAPSIDELLNKVRRERGIARSVRPRFRTETNIFDGPTPEVLVVFGKAVVVLGPGYRDGKGYFYYEVPAASAQDVLDVKTADLSGNGAEEVIFRVRQDLGKVKREVLLVHCLRPHGFPRILAVEVARKMGRESLENEVSIRRGGRRDVLVIEPGRARGWSRSNWPFESGGDDDGIAEPLLPWRDSAVGYSFDPRAGKLVARPVD